MSKADEMFKKLGYKKYISDEYIMYMKDLLLNINKEIIIFLK